MSAALNDNRPMSRLAQAEPFGSVSAAWMWTMKMLAARRDGADAGFGSRGIRPCEPDDVVKALDRLYRQRRIDLAHARILRIYGERQEEPNVSIVSQRGDRRLWDEAMERLREPLRNRGIVR